jgi:ferredoxin--NADP+ reductase
MEDFAAGKLRRRSDDDISEPLTRRGVQAVFWAGGRAIAAAERARGAAAPRPRAKFVEVGELVGAARI